MAHALSALGQPFSIPTLDGSGLFAILCLIATIDWSVRPINIELNVPLFCLPMSQIKKSKEEKKTCWDFHQADLSKPQIKAGGGFMYRVVTYLVNVLLVNGFAHSLTFPKFCSKDIQDSRRLVARGQELAEQLMDISRNFESGRGH